MTNTYNNRTKKLHTLKCVASHKQAYLKNCKVNNVRLSVSYYKEA